jgi:Protein of unknown function (DUF998)
MVAGAAGVAAGVFRRDHMLLTGPGFTGESWHNQVHDVVSGVAYAAMLAAPLVLGRRFHEDPDWAVVSRPVQVLALVSTVAMAVFASGMVEPWNGVVQRVAVTLPLTAETLVAARMLTLLLSGSPAVSCCARCRTQLRVPVQRPWVRRCRRVLPRAESRTFPATSSAGFGTIDGVLAHKHAHLPYRVRVRSGGIQPAAAGPFIRRIDGHLSRRRLQASPAAPSRQPASGATSIDDITLSNVCAVRENAHRAAVRRGCRLNADQDAGRADLGILRASGASVWSRLLRPAWPLTGVPRCCGETFGPVSSSLAGDTRGRSVSRYPRGIA